MVEFVREYLGDGTKRPDKFVVPHIVMQDILENLFGIVRTSTSCKHPTLDQIVRKCTTRTTVK